MSINDIDQKDVRPSVETVVEIKTPEQADAPALPGMMEKAIADVMGLEGDTERNRYQDKIGTLMEYVKTQTKDLSPENVKWVIRQLELKLGTPPFAENRINYVARYAFLLSEKRKLDDEMTTYERGF